MATTMDAAELARWTRFAAKGGIGKCTAVQDCVAESPEDLMFLKDDEITVLMQLSNQPGFYLGYCEGVVGRFQGDHVRFHGKLKRPIMTKRASASAVSVASSPVPSVTPSPQLPLSPLSNSTPSTGQAFDRDSRALSDPFDLELDAPPRLTNPRRSGSGSDDAPTTTATTAASSSAEPGDGDRRWRRTGDDLPGLEMFLPRSRSGSRSRPPSRGQGEDEKKSQRQQTRIMTPPQPPFATATTIPPRKDSLEIPPQSPQSLQSPLRTKQRLPSPSSSSPITATSPAPLSSPGKSEPENEKDKDKYDAENVQIRVGEEVKAVELPAVSTSPEPLTSIPEPIPRPRPEPESESKSEPEPVRVESPARDESSLYDTGSMRSSIYSTHSSYRSSVFGAGGENGNVDPVGLSAAASDAFARLEQADLDDGGFGMGIGLSMLQGMADDEDEGEGEGEVNGDVGAAPPTPRPPPGLESKESVIDERKQAKKEEDFTVDRLRRDEEEHDRDDDDEEYDEDGDGDDDGSYWDGADIYDNYRYSRFSMMTKNSRRKSRFSVMSKMSVASGGGGTHPPKKVPPVPLDAESRLRSDSAEAAKEKEKEKEEAEKGRKHIPPPLNLVKPGPSASTALLSPANALSPAPSSARFSAAGSDQLSPLLHTCFASPHSSASQNTSYGTDESDRSPESHAPNFVHRSGRGLALSTNGGLGGGAASALRQRLEHGRSVSPTPLPSPVPQKELSSTVDSASERESSEGPGTGIVVEDDESVNVTVVPTDEGNGSNSSPRIFEHGHEHAKDRELVRDSLQSAVSTATTDSTTMSTSSDISEVSGVMRKIEQGLASVSAFGVSASATASPPPPNIRATLADADGTGTGTPTPTAMEFSVGTTQPLRVQDRAGSRLTPSHSPSPSPSPTSDPNLNRALSHAPPPSPSPRLQSQQLPVQQDAKPSEGPHILRPEQALFPPHPNAPRPNPAVLSGQRQSTYGMPPVHEPQPQPSEDPSAAPLELPGMSLEAALRSASVSRMGPAGVPHRATIYGKTVVDLASADGPVAIVWSLSPFPPDPPSRQGSPAPGGRVPRRAATAGASPLSQSVSVLVSSQTTPTPSTNNKQPQTSLPPPSPVTCPPSRSASPAQNIFPRSTSPSVSDNPTPNPSTSTHSTSNVLLRPNFQPRVGVARPRSRSFSDIAGAVPAKPVLKERSSEEGSRPTRVASFQSLREAAGMGHSNKTIPVNGRNAQTRSSRHSSSSSISAVNGNGSPPKRGIHAPSPLSRPGNNALLGTPRGSSLSKPASPSSPLARSFLSSNQSLPDQDEQTPDAEKGGGNGSVGGGGGPSGLHQPVMPVARLQGVRQVASVDSLKIERSEQPLVGPPRSILQPIRRNSGPASGVSSTPPVPAPSSNATSSATGGQSVAPSSSPIKRLRRMSSPSSKRHERSISRQSQTSSNSELRSTVSPPPNTCSSSTPSPVQRNASLKSKLSLSHLRIRHTGGKDSLDTQTTSPSTGPQTPVFDYDNQPETVQVQDAEFEMIRPTMRRFSTEPASEESAMGQDERPSLHRDSSVESPISSSARSVSVLSGQPSTIADSRTEQGHPKPSKPAEDAAGHRTRELKWMSLMSSVPASQARKSKKIRKLLLEGVPSSVRYLVWSHLTDSKAKRIPGVYGQLGRRGRVAASQVIERDAARCFPDQPHLQDPKGPLVGLLQTYLTMVPDIEYQTSLSLVAGHLLLQSPEEDGFWTFTSIMDFYLRAYFSSKSVQMDADAIIFATSVELTYPQLAKRLFKGLSISPGEIFRAWFPSLFATTLPQDYVNRIWDVYLYDGPPFLFRVALAILSCCRSAIESSNDRMAVLAFLIRPETLHLLPDSPDEFIGIALAIKLKDEDIRKHRAKVEADLRRRRSQFTHRGNAPRLVSSISLPRAGSVPAPPL